MNLEQLQGNWDRLGAADPLWAILSHTDKRGNAWHPDEFFATGEGLIDETLAWVDTRCPGVGRGRALDFGCGAGRLTQALAREFAEVVGVDIAPSMLALAEEHNRHGERCRFVHNAADDLALFPAASFDLVCSFIVLQHVEPRFVRRYLQAFLRVLKPGGVLVFQLPARPRPGLKGLLRRVLAVPRLQPLLNTYRRVWHRRPADMEMYGIPRDEVIAELEAAGGKVIDVAGCASAGPTWSSFRYLVRRSADAVAGGG